MDDAAQSDLDLDITDQQTMWQNEIWIDYYLHSNK